jgi:hypothetical protein
MRKVGIAVLWALVALLIAVQVAAPFVAGEVARRTLGTVPGYTATVGSVTPSLLGQVILRDLRFVRDTGKIREPFLVVDRIRIRPVLGDWLRGRRVVNVVVDGFAVNLVIGPTEAETQTAIDPEWIVRQVAKFPATVDALTMGGTARYLDTAASPDVDLAIRDVVVDGTNLANRSGSAEPLFGAVDVAGRVMTTGALSASVRVDPYAPVPTFDLVAHLRDLELREIDRALRAYGRFDVKAGRLSVATHIRARDGGYVGVARPVVTDLKVGTADDDGGKKPNLAWQAVVGLAAKIGEALTGGGKDTIAVDLPIRGTFGEVPAPIEMLKVLPNAWFGAFTRAADASIGAGRAAEEAAGGVGKEVRREKARR